MTHPSPSIHSKMILIVLVLIISFQATFFDPLLIRVSGSTNIVSEVELADTDHLILVPDAQTLENNFDQSTISTTTELATITLLTTDDATKVLSSVAAAYRTINPLFNLVVTTVASGALVKSGFIDSGLYDFAVTPSTPTAADYEAVPTLEYLPFLATGIASAYNLPDSFTNGFPLRFSGPVLCRIYRGNITHWTDPTIQALNPNMNWSKMSPNQLIEVITLTYGTIVHQSFCQFCSKIDPVFASLIPVSSLPTYYALFQTPVSSLSIAGDALSDSPYSITMTTIPRAQSIPLNIVTMVSSSSSGAIDLSGDTQSVELAVTELASRSSSFAVDLTNPTNPQGWPVSNFQYVYIDNAHARVTCYNKRILLQFLIWAFSNDLPRALFTAASIIPLPEIIEARFSILTHLRNDILCDNAALVSANAATLFVSADAASTGLISIYSQFYTGIDSTYNFATRSLPESLSLERLRVNEAAFALVRTGLFNDADLDMIARHGFVSIPAFIAGVVPIFNLPLEIIAMSSNITGQLFYQLPALYPLVLDVDTLTRIFLGNMTDWLDADMIRLNPQLSSWFNVTQANTTLTIVVGASGASDPSAAAKIIFKVMHKSNVVRQSAYRKIFGSSTEIISNNAPWKKSTNPFGLLLDVSYVDNVPQNMIMLDSETRLSVKTSVTPGSISYRTVGSQGIGVSDETVEFRMIHTNTAGVREVVSGTTTNMNACNAPHLDSNAIDAAGGSLTYGYVGSNPLLDINVQREWISILTPPPGCYPLFVMISIVMPLQYTSNDSGASSTTATSTTSTYATSSSGSSSTCLVAEHGIEFANYIQTTDSLSLPAEQLGLVRMASSSILQQLSQSVFYASTCDGSPVLVTVPSYFHISSAISQFGYAIGAIGLVVTMISLVLVMVYRHRVIIRSSSVPFLIMILCGVGFLYVALITWSYGPTSSTGSCTSFIWFSQLGFMLVYVPLFAKTYRVWRIFSGSHLKVVKISNRKLLLMSLAAIAVDILILAIWQGVSPLHPIQYVRPLNDHWDYYTHCSVTSTGLPFVIIEAVYKAGILLFGALMAFSTRNVKATFNESTQIAWSIYNTLLAAIIVAIMIIFLNAIQSTLIIMVQILLLWMPFCTWALLFIPKFQLLLKTENEVIEASRSELLPQEKSNGFSFASVAFMSGSQLKSYYDALKTQVIKVQQRLGVAVSKFEPAPSSKDLETIGAINSKCNNSGLGGSKNRSKNNTFTYSNEPQTSKGINAVSGGAVGTGPGANYNFATTRLSTFNNKTTRPLMERSITGGGGADTPRGGKGSPLIGPASSTTNVPGLNAKPSQVPPNQLMNRLSSRQTNSPIPGDESSLVHGGLPTSMNVSLNHVRMRSDSPGTTISRESSPIQRYQPIHTKKTKSGTNLHTRLAIEEHNTITNHNSSHYLDSHSSSMEDTSAPSSHSTTIEPMKNATTLPGSTVPTVLTTTSLDQASSIPIIHTRDSVESIDLSHMAATTTLSSPPEMSPSPSPKESVDRISASSPSQRTTP